VFADVAQTAEHPPCKRRVVGSIPTVGYRGQLFRAAKEADCKSAGVYLRGFESLTAHFTAPM
jgi:hypothetical protein